MLLNKKHVKQFTLDAAKQFRPFHPFERVGESWYTDLDAAVRRLIVGKVKALPSKGKTIR